MPGNLNIKDDKKSRQIEFIKQSFQEQGLSEKDAYEKACAIVNSHANMKKEDAEYND